MRIVDRKTFLSLPPGTIFLKYPAQPDDKSYYDLAPDGEVQIKWDTVAGVDFVCQNLIPFPEGWSDDRDVTQDHIAMLSGKEGKAADYNCAARDGLFDDDQLFLVWGAVDHQKLIDLLQLALSTQKAKAAD